METISLPVLAGMVSTSIFASSMLPMLVKAARTRDLSSYSIGNLVLANIGNAVHSVYVFHLPLGPIWFLHGFYLLTSALMLSWWVRYQPDMRQADHHECGGLPHVEESDQQRQQRAVSAYSHT